MNERNRPDLTKAEVLTTCRLAYRNLDAVTELLDPAKRLDLVTMSVLLEAAASTLARALDWNFPSHPDDTLGSREAAIELLLPAQAKLGALIRLCAIHWADLPDNCPIDGSRQMMMSSLMDINQALGMGIFQQAHQAHSGKSLFPEDGN